MTPQTDGAISLGSATNGFNNMYLDGSAYVGGNVGIGTTNPSKSLTISSSTPVIRLEDTDQSVEVELKNVEGDGILTTNGASSLKLQTNNLERLRIAPSGQLGIGGANYGTSGQVLTSGGSGAAPTWADAAEASFTFSATASGSIDANRVAAVNSDGTMSALYSTNSGSVTNVTNTNDARRIAMAPVTDNLYFYMWDDDNSSTANCNKVALLQKSTGTVDANVLTVGTPVEVNNDSRRVCDAVYDPDNQRITYFWA